MQEILKTLVCGRFTWSIAHDSRIVFRSWKLLIAEQTTTKRTKSELFAVSFLLEFTGFWLHMEDGASIVVFSFGLERTIAFRLWFAGQTNTIAVRNKRNISIQSIWHFFFILLIFWIQGDTIMQRFTDEVFSKENENGSSNSHKKIVKLTAWGQMSC